jgi:hypothetical protein
MANTDLFRLYEENLQRDEQPTDEKSSPRARLRQIGEAFVKELCRQYPEAPPDTRMEMECAMEALLHYYSYEWSIVYFYVGALKKANAHDTQAVP